MNEPLVPTVGSLPVIEQEVRNAVQQLLNRSADLIQRSRTLQIQSNRISDLLKRLNSESVSLVSDQPY